jgi:uncharacterized RDD family membrane protein YckC
MPFCNTCGAELAAGAAFCGGCGSAQPAAARPASAPAYAGFWIRLLAYFIDQMITSAAASIVIVPIAGAVGLGALSRNRELLLGLLASYVAIALLAMVGQFLYHALFESSNWQATPGKRILGLKVTDCACLRISFGRAAGRYAGKILSGLILGLGYVMAGIDPRKQALHDKLAGTLVLRG